MPATPPLLQRVAIFGVGLIGGSFALGLKRAGQIVEVVGVDRSSAHLERALALGIIDRAETDPVAALTACDLVVLAAPVAQTRALLDSIAPHLGAQTIVTDVGSTKGDVVAAARAALGSDVSRFVPGHPIAGREVHGPEAALADLFNGKKTVLTPLPESAPKAVALVRAAWEACGAQVMEMPVATHDAVLAAVSHLPHVLAYALVAQIAQSPDAALKFDFVGGGFRDFTRIAASSPEMWRDVSLANRDALLDELDAYQASLEHVRDLIARGDGVALEALYTLASTRRLELNQSI